MEQKQERKKDIRKPIGCWHVGNKDRLRKNLDCNRCDLWPLKADLGSWERYSAEWWFDKKMQLKIQDRVRFCCKGEVLCMGTIESKPYRLDKPLDNSFRSAVAISDIDWLDVPERCNHRDSHRLLPATDMIIQGKTGKTGA